MPLNVGDILTLPDGSEVTMIGGRDQIVPGVSFRQIVFVGNRSGESDS